MSMQRYDRSYGSRLPTANIVKSLAPAVLAVFALPLAGADYVVEFGAGQPTQSGYLQTPAGGMPGTASSKRPTLAEIDLDRGRYRWLGAGIDFGRKGGGTSNVAPFRLRFHARYTTVGDDAASRVAEAFTIRGGVFEAGDRVRSRVSYNRLTLALTGGFDLGPGLAVEIGPEVGWTAFDFTMRGERHRADRAYHVTTFGLAGEIRRELGNGWQIGARIAAAPAIEGTGSRYAAEPWLGRSLSRRFGFAIGARLEGFRYDDAHKQELPNHLQVKRIVPMLAVRLRF